MHILVPRSHKLAQLGLLMLLCCFCGCGDQSADSANSQVATQAQANVLETKRLNFPGTVCSFVVPESWQVDRHVYGAEFHATAPSPTTTGYTTNIRLVSSQLKDQKGLDAYWTQNRDEALEHLSQCTLSDERSVTLENGHVTRRAVFNFVNRDSTPLTMYVCAVTHGDRGYTFTGLAPTEHADAYAPIFNAAFDSLNFN